MFLLYIKARHNFKNVVISFLNRANPFRRVCLFCNFVRNKIYVMEIEMLKLVSMARNHKFDFGRKSSLFDNSILPRFFTLRYLNFQISGSFILWAFFRLFRPTFTWYLIYILLIQLSIIKYKSHQNMDKLNRESGIKLYTIWNKTPHHFVFILFYWLPSFYLLT